jgi:hypothetical protein
MNKRSYKKHHKWILLVAGGDGKYIQHFTWKISREEDD